MENKKVQFEASGNLSDFMKKIHQDAKKMYEGIAKEAKAQTKVEGEQFKIIKEKIALLKEQLKLEKEIAREKLSAAKADFKEATGYEKTKAAGDSLRRAQEEWEMLSHRGAALRGANRVFGDERSKGKDRGGESIPTSTISIAMGTLLADVIKDAFKALRQTTTAGSGLDLLSPYSTIAGSIVGGGSGTLIDTLAGMVGVKTNAAVFGSKTGGEVGGLAGDLVTRSFRTRDEYDQAFNRYSALTGGTLGDLGPGRMLNHHLNMGYTDADLAGASARVATAQGKGKDARYNADLLLGLNRGYGIGEGTTLGAMAMGRSGGGNGSANILKTLGVAIGEGLDRTKFADAITNQVSLMQQFASTSNKVNVDSVNRTMFEFNRMGGAFGIGDPRSMGKISAINSGLANPDAGFGAAMSYQVLSELNPNGSAWDILKMQEKGLQTKGYLSGMMNKIKGVSSSSMIQKMLLRGVNGFKKGQLSGEDIDTLFAGQGNIGSMSSAALSKSLDRYSVQSEGERLTSQVQSDTAKVTNAFKDGFMDGINVLETQFKERMSAAVDEVAKHLVHKFKASTDDGVQDAVGKVDAQIHGIFPKDVRNYVDSAYLNNPNARHGFFGRKPVKPSK